MQCPDHYDADGHILFHVLANIENVSFPTSYTAFKTVPLKSRRVDAVAILLILSDEPGGLPPLNLGQPVDEACLEMILEDLKRVTTSQFAMLASLYGICSRILNKWGANTEDLAMVLICALKALDLPRDDRAIPIIRPAVNQILRIRTVMRDSTFRKAEEIERVSVVGMECVDRLNTHLAATFIFGGQNCRVLSCARRPQNFSPAIGWLAEYVD
jgi:hypothetical protein